MTPAAPTVTTFHVTDHALLRWRERVAAYADAPVDDLLAALRESEVVDPKLHLLPPGVVILDGQRYRVMRGRPKVVFVTEARSPTFEVVVTVVDHEVRPFPPPKARLLRPGNAADATPAQAPVKAAAPPCREDPAAALRDEYLFQTFAHAGEEREWLRGKWKALTQAATGMTKSHPDRPSVVAQLSWLTGRMQKQKLAYKAWKVAESRRLVEEGGVYQENGELNQSAALHHLLKEVARLSAEVEALKRLSPQFLPVTPFE